MDKILVLGINGFTGKHFQDFIAKNKLLERFSFIGADKVIEKRLDKLDYRKVELLLYKDFERLVLEIVPDYIMNFAGIFNSKSFSRLQNINAGISRNIFEIILRNNLMVKNILLIGSAAEYGPNSGLPITEEARLNPVTAYGASKVIQTVYANYYAALGLNVNIARTFNVIGKYLSPALSVSSFAERLRKAHNKDTILVGNLHTRRDFLDIDDVVSAYWKILFFGRRGEVYNVSSGKSLCMKDILDFLVKKSGKKINIQIKEEYVRKNDIPDSYGDNTKLRRDTDWKKKKDIFTTLSEMLCC